MATQTVATARRPRWWPPTALRPLADPALALLWTGLATSAVGDQLFTVALAWISTQVLGPRAGYLNALQPAVILAVALLGGRWADQVAHRRLMVATDLARAVVLAGLVGIWWALGQPPAAALVVAVVALAGGQALFRPAVSATLPVLVREPARLPAANGLFEMTERIARLVGPGLVGMLAAFVPLIHYVTLDVATFLVSAAAIVGTLRLRPAAMLPTERPEPVLASMTRGFRAMRGHRLLGFVLLIAGPGAGIWFAILFLATPLLLATQPGAAPDGGLRGYGLILASYGLGNLAGAFVVASRPMPARPGWMMFGADLVLGAGLAGIGLSFAFLPPAWVVPASCAAAAFGAVGGPMSDIPMAVLRQTRLAAGEQAAAMRAVLAMWNFGTLAALLLAPTAFAAIGVAATVVTGGAIIIACGALGVLLHATTEG